MNQTSHTKATLSITLLSTILFGAFTAARNTMFSEYASNQSESYDTMERFFVHLGDSKMLGVGKCSDKVSSSGIFHSF